MALSTLIPECFPSYSQQMHIFLGDAGIYKMQKVSWNVELQETVSIRHFFHDVMTDDRDKARCCHSSFTHVSVNEPNKLTGP